MDPSQPPRPIPTPGNRSPHHYVLAHIAFRQICLADPRAFFSLMVSDHRQAFLEDIWKEIRKDCDRDGLPNFSIEDIQIEAFCIGDYPALLFQMPEPQCVGEAHILAIILKATLDELEAGNDEPEVIYFTLEKGTQLDTGKPRTVLCSWEGESHLNHGDGPPATPQDFVRSIVAIIGEPVG